MVPLVRLRRFAKGNLAIVGGTETLCSTDGPLNCVQRLDENMAGVHQRYGTVRRADPWTPAYSGSFLSEDKQNQEANAG